MKRAVYIETTVFSFYYDLRPKSAFRRQITREWWRSQKQNFDLYTSRFTVEEVSEPVYPVWEKVAGLARGLTLLDITPEIAGIVKAYIDHKLMPKDDAGDAAHLAVASYHEVDYLMTWNCRHLANANKFEHIRKINQRLGLLTPEIVTPELLFVEE